MDPRSPFVLNTHELARRPGTMRTVEREVTAPDDYGTAVMGVVPGSTMRLDLRLESVMEGVLLSGDAEVELRGECVRCLRDISASSTVPVSELFLYPGARESARAEGDEEADDMYELEGELLDLEPVLRDAVVGSLPFHPLCEEGCLGLCPGCGERMADLPEGHEHVDLDPRWAALAALAGEPGDDTAADSSAADDAAEGR